MGRTVSARAQGSDDDRLIEGFVYKCLKCLRRGPGAVRRKSRRRFATIRAHMKAPPELRHSRRVRHSINTRARRPCGRCDRARSARAHDRGDSRAKARAYGSTCCPDRKHASRVSARRAPRWPIPVGKLSGLALVCDDAGDRRAAFRLSSGRLTGPRRPDGRHRHEGRGGNAHRHGRHHVRRPRSQGGGHDGEVRRPAGREGLAGEGQHRHDDAWRRCASSRALVSSFPPTSPATARRPIEGRRQRYRQRHDGGRDAETRWRRASPTKPAPSSPTSSRRPRGVRARLDDDEHRARVDVSGKQGQVLVSPVLLDFGKNPLALDARGSLEGRRARRSNRCGSRRPISSSSPATAA